VVSVKLTPKYAGLRQGAVVFFDNSGNQLANVPLYGTGEGPQIAFGPGKQSSLGGGFDFAYGAGIALDASGNIYVADNGNQTLLPLGVIYLIPPGCTSVSCVSLLGGGFGAPNGVAIDGAGNVFVADPNNDAVKEMPPGCASSSCVTTLASALNNPTSVAVDVSGNVYVAVQGSNAVVEILAVGGVVPANPAIVTLGGTFNFQAPTGIAVDGSGNVYVADTGNNAVREMTPGCASSACVTTLGGVFNSPEDVAVDGIGNVYVADYHNNMVVEMPPGCQSSSCVTALGFTGRPSAFGVAVDSSGNVYIADEMASVITELNRSTAPSLTFTTPTALGSTDTNDGTKTVQVTNIGNQALTFTATGVSYPADFSAASDANPCSSSESLNAGQECDLAIQFTPQSAGAPLSEDVTLTDNNLNVAGTQQSIAVSGTAPAPAVLTFPTPNAGTQLGTNPGFAWSGGVGVTYYQLNLGSTGFGSSDLYNSGNLPGTVSGVKVSGPGLPSNGGTVYARLYSFIDGAWQHFDYTYFESGTPAAAALTSPTPNVGIQLGANPSFAWSGGAGVSYYELNLGSAGFGSSDLYSSGVLAGTATGVTVTGPGLPSNGGTVYASLYSFIDGAWQHNYYTYLESGTPSAAALISPTPNVGTALGANPSFAWSGGVGVSYYELNLGSTGVGSSDLYSSGNLPGTATGVTVTGPGLPPNGSTVYARLYSFIDRAWQHHDYTYKESN
jgi:streptogramin lyase